mgnify:CR=1 FL=1
MAYHTCCGFPEPQEGSVFYEGDFSYACFAFAPKTEGHSIVAWRAHAKDLNDLSEEEYHHLMGVVRRVRIALGRVYPGALVYMDYWNEAGHVHFHLIPRHEGSEKMGPDLLVQPSGRLVDLSKIPLLVTSLG